MPDAARATLQRFGIRQKRVAGALPQTAQAAIFNVLTGRVAIIGLLGRVTVVIGATATNLSIISNPTVGADIVLATVVAIANDAVGSGYGITGIPADAVVKGNAYPMCQRPVVVPAGTIDLLTSASVTGSVEWDFYWVPVDAGARVTAA